MFQYSENQYFSDFSTQKSTGGLFESLLDQDNEPFNNLSKCWLSPEDQSQNNCFQVSFQEDQENVASQLNQNNDEYLYDQNINENNIFEQNINNNFQQDNNVFEQNNNCMKTNYFFEQNNENQQNNFENNIETLYENSNNFDSTHLNLPDGNDIHNQKHDNNSFDIVNQEIQTQDKKKKDNKQNKYGKKCHEETKNLFVLSGPYIIGVLKQRIDTNKQWQKVQCLFKDYKTQRSLQFFNTLLKEIEEQDLVLPFRKMINRILDHDYVLYSQNQKSEDKQYINMKYQHALKLILNHDSYTFNSVKLAQVLQKQFIEN